MPKLVAVSLPDGKPVTPFAGKLSDNQIGTLQSAMFRGVTNKDGTWAKSPAAGWKVERLDVGLYKITHTLGYPETSVNISLTESPGSFTVEEHTPTYFVVQTTVNKVPSDRGLAFALVRVISQKGQR